MNADCAMAGSFRFVGAPAKRGRAKVLAKANAETYVNRYSDMILRLSLTYVDSYADAEDVCQDVLIKLMTSAPAFADAEHEKAWVLRTAINRCKDILKSARHRTSVPLDDTIAHPAAASVESEVLAKESDVLSAVRQLTDDQRDCVFLYYYEDMKIEEIADLVGKSPTAVAKHLSRARQSLRTMLERNDHDR